MSRFQFVADHRHAFEVKWLCEVVEVARSSFYAWCAAADTRAAKTAADETLAQRIHAVHTTDSTYGAPRITAELNDGVPEAQRVNHKRVARVMRSTGIAGYRSKRRVKTTAVARAPVTFVSADAGPIPSRPAIASNSDTNSAGTPRTTAGMAPEHTHEAEPSARTPVVT